MSSIQYVVETGLLFMWKALSNTYLLALIFSHTSVESILKCEQTCRLWKNVSRNDTSQVWLPKLIRAFPEGCAPERYGEENWRDVAALWYAWGRQWTPKTMQIEVPTLGEHEAFPIRTGFKHQLTFAATHPRSDYNIRGISVSGEVMYRTADEVNPMHQGNVLTAPNHSTPMPSQQIFTLVRAQQTHPKADPNLKPLMTTTSNRECGYRICGNVMATYAYSHDPIAYTTTGTTATWLEDDSAFRRAPNSLLSFNEKVAAYFERKSDDSNVFEWRLKVIRLKDQKLLDREDEVDYFMEPDPNVKRLIVTRFNVLFLVLAAGRLVCKVYDSDLKHWSTLKLMDNITHLQVSDDGGFIIIHRSAGYRVVLYDVLKRQKFPLTRDPHDKRDGWFFGVTEYAVGMEGKRTGDIGNVKVYFRTIHDL
ncbi:hypothetical protein HK097_009625 [Rhizophlyctis rosea]|uniref:F-box domain-containing protein n=1 Tax=Rhizophlyctis rosea TaxID=64517 RepID=A0AAD5SA99_9FUNG|nr:hypothetical protein HK097_009625 [Rhizophlyctis rosea]